MKDIASINRFREQSTWRLVGLGVITYGIYFAYYIKRQTHKINASLTDDQKISDGFINTLLIFSYVSLFLFFGYMVVDEGHPLEPISSVIDSVWNIMLIVWGFKARNRVNTIFEISKNDQPWFHGMWTFLFSELYFNYKINQICEQYVEKEKAADS